jgi:hypothetical protein
MAKLEDFKTVIISNPKAFRIKTDDKIVVTQENIEFLRQYLKTTNFRWRSGHHVTDSNASIRNDTEPAFGIDRVLIFESDGVWTNTFDQIDKDSLSDAVNYFFVDY